MTSNLTLIGTHDANLYVGTRIEARIKLTDSWTDEALTTLAPALAFIDPDGNSHDAGTMELIGSDGTYSGSYVPTTDGDWTVTMTIGSPFETYRRFSLYVSPRLTP